MKAIRSIMRLGLGLSLSVFMGKAVLAQTYEDMGAQLSQEEQRGRDLWFKATAGNKWHHSYVLQQRFGAPLDFYRTMGSATRGRRFATYGLINDPDCKAGNAASFGFDICPGDEQLLAAVGRKNYRDPACDFDQNALAENACLLEFGTSAGAVGFRKFPNPRFRADRWPGWEKWNVQDASVEPPFLFGTSCASCHVGFDPKRPPRDPEFPSWANIDGTVGNIFLDNTAIFAAGLKQDAPLGALFFQAIAHVRPGTTDTSAIPQDFVHNTGTFNAILNFDRRPTFTEEVKRWRREGLGAAWELSTQPEKVMHVLKGGEDTVGSDLALLRVYVNIGMCSETCWQNNLVNIRQFSGPNLQQKPFDIAACRRSCGAWRSMEDRIGDMASFLMTRRPADLSQAVDPEQRPVGASILKQVAALYDPAYKAEGGVFAAGRRVFARNCASCHSSAQPKLPGQPRDEKFFATVDFLARDSQGVLIDWLGNDERSDVSLIGTNRCRALHSNHSRGHIWEQFSSEDFKASPPPSSVPELEGLTADGRGYYRNISLLNVWANAPFLHNNALGPEYCSPFNRQAGSCVKRNPSIEARLAMYEASMRQLLYPETRPEKITRTTEDVGLTLEIPLSGQRLPTPFLLNIPKGTPVGLLGSMNLAQFANGILDELQAELAGKNLRERIRVVNAYLKQRFADRATLESTLLRASNCQDLVEDKGHSFGAELSDREKLALIQYMKNF